MVINMVYGGGRRLRVVNWTIARLASWSIQDTRINDLWTRQGPPPEATLVDVILQKNRLLAASNVVLVIEHESFEPVASGMAIPEQTVVFLELDGAMEYIKNMPTDDKHNYGA